MSKDAFPQEPQQSGHPPRHSDAGSAPPSAPRDAITYYSQKAEEFHESYRKDANRRERILVWRDFIERYGRDARLAYDMGCGSGIITCEIAARGMEVIGIDGSATMLDLARATARGQAVTVSFLQHSLPIADISGFRPADLIISSSVIEYLESVPEALASFRKLLREGGILIFSVPNHDSLSRKLVRLVHRLTGRPQYLAMIRHVMTVERIRDELSQAGLTYLDHAYFARADIINRFLALFFEPRRASNMIIVACRRG